MTKRPSGSRSSAPPSTCAASGISFEILAIDEDSGDNSHAVLALLRAEVPELRVTHAPGRGRGVDVGAARAQGTLLLVSTPDVASGSLDGAGDACRRLLAGEGDAEVALGRFTVAHRDPRARRRSAARRLRRRGDAPPARQAPADAAASTSAASRARPASVAKSAVGRLRAFARFG